MNALPLKSLVLVTFILASCAPPTKTAETSTKESEEKPVATEAQWKVKIAEPRCGDQWIYAVTMEYEKGTFSARDGQLVANEAPVEMAQVVEVTGVEPVIPGAPIRFATSNTEDGKLVSIDKFALVDDLLVIVSVQPATASGEPGDEVLVFKPEYVLVPAQLVAGYSWSESHDLGPVPMVDAMTVMGKETITVPAGEFEAWRIRRNRTLGEGQTTSFKEDYWFVEGVGIVKTEVERFDGGKRVWSKETALREKRGSATGG